MAYQALQRLRWGDGWIDPGEDVPAGERGRNYAALLAAGRIAVKASSSRPEPKHPASAPEEPASPQGEPEEQPEPKPKRSNSTPAPKPKASGRKKK